MEQLKKDYINFFKRKFNFHPYKHNYIMVDPIEILIDFRNFYNKKGSNDFFATKKSEKDVWGKLKIITFDEYIKNIK